jgi:hypothetical protein
LVRIQKDFQLLQNYRFWTLNYFHFDERQAYNFYSYKITQWVF